MLDFNDLKLVKMPTSIFTKGYTRIWDAYSICFL